MKSGEGGLGVLSGQKEVVFSYKEVREGLSNKMLCRYGSLMKRGNRLAKQTIWGNCSRWRENSKCKCSGAGPGLAGLSETSGAEGECWEVRGKGVNRVGPPKTGPSMVTSLPFIWKWTAGGRS